MTVKSVFLISISLLAQSFIYNMSSMRQLGTTTAQKTKNAAIYTKDMAAAITKNTINAGKNIFNAANDAYNNAGSYLLDNYEEPYTALTTQNYVQAAKDAFTTSIPNAIEVASQFTGNLYTWATEYPTESVSVGLLGLTLIGVMATAATIKTIKEWENVLSKDLRKRFSEIRKIYKDSIFDNKYKDRAEALVKKSKESLFNILTNRGKIPSYIKAFVLDTTNEIFKIQNSLFVALEKGKDFVITSSPDFIRTKDLLTCHHEYLNKKNISKVKSSFQAINFLKYLYSQNVIKKDLILDVIDELSQIFDNLTKWATEPINQADSAGNKFLKTSNNLHKNILNINAVAQELGIEIVETVKTDENENVQNIILTEEEIIKEIEVYLDKPEDDEEMSEEILLEGLDDE